MTCPTPDRPAHPTEGSAWNAIRETRVNGTSHLLPYPCGDHWHTESPGEAMTKRQAARRGA